MEDFAEVSGRVGYQMKRAQNTLRRRMDEELRGLGLTTPQYAALTALEEEDGVSGAELARRCFVTAQTMNGVVINLEREGMVFRREHPRHGRVIETVLTDAGRETLKAAESRVREIEERMLAGIPVRERDRLARTLQGCADALEDE